MDRVLFAAELEFPKILVPRQPQNTSNGNIECARKSKQLYSLCNQLLGALIFCGKQSFNWLGRFIYVNLANTSLVIFLGEVPTLNLPIKIHPLLR